MNEPHQHNSEGYETSDVPSRNLFIALATLIVVIVVILIALNEIFIASTEREITESVLKPESAELRELRAKETETLNSYKMLDEEQGIVQIPITRAMQLMSEEEFQKKMRLNR